MPSAIAIAGSLNMDFIVSVAALPFPGQTVLGSGFRTLPGGKGANQAYAVARLGGEARMIGRIGDDGFGEEIKTGLAAAGVNVDGVLTSAGPTGIALITVGPDGQNMIVVAPGANTELLPADVESLRTSFAGARFLLLQLEIPLDTVAQALLIAREEKLVTILDPAPARKLPAEMLAGVDILTPNETEAQILLGRVPGRIDISGGIAIAKELRELGPRIVVVTLGDTGCVVADRNGTTHYRAYDVEAVDATAAGDTFNAALAVALAEERLFPHAIEFASAAAAISVTRPGAQASAPTRDEVQAFLEVRG